MLTVWLGLGKKHVLAQITHIPIHVFCCHRKCPEVFCQNIIHMKCSAPSSKISSRPSLENVETVLNFDQRLVSLLVCYSTNILSASRYESQAINM